MTQEKCKEAVDVDAYVERVTTGPCFLCEMLDGNPDYYRVGDALQQVVPTEMCLIFLLMTDNLGGRRPDDHLA